jgi:DNA/RNA-binding domain of Phe-tRNA-synthetase-like protein
MARKGWPRSPVLDMRIDPELASALTIGVLVLEDVGPPASPSAADQAVRGIEEHVRAKLSGQAEREEFRAAARKLYRAFGIDPTKHRPSSEQLLLRVLKGDPFPRVNALVDAVNVCQLLFGLPYGLYDLDRVSPPVVARKGHEGEAYAGIRKGSISVAGRPALADAEGAFGNPSSDSDRTKTSETTRRALLVVFGSPALADPEWTRVLSGTKEEVLRHVRARITEERVVRAGADAS